MPMWSAATRSMFIAAAAIPRKKFPPPTTSPICTPALATSAISPAKLFTRSGSTPQAPPPASASPLSFRTMRLYLGILWRRLLRRPFDQRRLAHLEAPEARHGNVLPPLRDRPLDQIAPRGRILAPAGLLVRAPPVV